MSPTVSLAADAETAPPGAAAAAGSGVPQAVGERALRQVHRAVAELRRGAAVLLLTEGGAWLAAAAELASITTIGRLADAPPSSLPAPTLLLAPARAAAFLHGPAPGAANVPAIAFRLRAGVTPAELRGLADPTASLPASLPEPAGPVPEEAAAAAIHLAKLARLLPAVIVAPVEAGSDALGFAQRADLVPVRAGEVLGYPDMVAATLTRVAEASVPLEDSASTRVIAYRPADGGTEHLAIVVGDPEGAGTPPLVRLHSECFTGDLLGSLRCDCGPQLRGALKLMAEEGAGVLLYLAQEGRGIGLVNKLRAYTLQDGGADTHDANTRLGYGADERNFMIAAAMLRDLGVPEVRILTNNPDKLAALEACGIRVANRVAHAFPPTPHNARYLRTKAERFGHLF